MNKGKIKGFNDQKGFGFIEQENGADIFVHKNELLENYVEEGDEVQFVVADGTKGPCATQVYICK